MQTYIANTAKISTKEILMVLEVFTRRIVFAWKTVGYVSPPHFPCTFPLKVNHSLLVPYIMVHFKVPHNVVGVRI